VVFDGDLRKRFSAAAGVYLAFFRVFDSTNIMPRAAFERVEL